MTLYLKNKSLFISFLLIITCIGCKNNTKQSDNSTIRTFKVKNLSDQEYPDNPDIGFRADNYQNQYFDKGTITPKKNPFVVDLNFTAKNGDHIELHELNISEFIPSIPHHIKADEYLSYISCINQEWNRNQVRFNSSEFNSNQPIITRVDIARNCLNAYLWEIIIYTNEKGKQLPYAHGWFDFPHHYYAALFEQKNGVSFEKFRIGMENWTDPKSKIVDLEKLRKRESEVGIIFQDLSDEMYPKTGAREKKFKEIIVPQQFSTMRDLQDDTSLFATFTPPGFYNRKDPRKTELGRIYTLKNISINKLTQKEKTTKNTYEIHLEFLHKNNSQTTQLIIGGIRFDDIPKLSPKNANKGWKSSMGIGNHTFYESYSQHLNTPSTESSYYALLLDANNKWLDSHKIGIDGPLLHFDDQQPNQLHLWLLSFERHALVGHYSIDFLEKEFY